MKPLCRMANLWKMICNLLPVGHCLSKGAETSLVWQLIYVPLMIWIALYHVIRHWWKERDFSLLEKKRKMLFLYYIAVWFLTNKNVLSRNKTKVLLWNTGTQLHKDRTEVTRVQEGSLYCENGLLVINDSNHASALRDWTIGADSSNNWPSALLVIHRVQKGVHAWCYKLGFQIMQEAEKRQILKRSISPSYHADVLPYIMALLWKLPSKYQDSHL